MSYNEIDKFDAKRVNYMWTGLSTGWQAQVAIKLKFWLQLHRSSHKRQVSKS